MSTIQFINNPPIWRENEAQHIALPSRAFKAKNKNSFHPTIKASLRRSAKH
jgi:hypothetical protein